MFNYIVEHMEELVAELKERRHNEKDDTFFGSYFYDSGMVSSLHAELECY